MFDIFYQVHPQPDEAQGGLGIGLALVRQLVELHGGAVEARSEGRGRGSEFAVRIPLRAAVEPVRSAPEAGLDGHASRRGASSSSTTIAMPPNRWR